MTDRFNEKWEGKLGGIKGAVRPIKPLRNQIQNAIKRIESQLNRISREIEEYNRRESNLTENLIQAYEKHYEDRAKIIANELAEIRKHKELLIASKISLDKAALRLRMIYEIGDFTSVILSAKETVREVRSKVADFIPGVGSELGYVEEMLSNIVADTYESAKMNLNFDAESEEVERILEEAAIVAEGKVKVGQPETSKKG